MIIKKVIRKKFLFFSTSLIGLYAYHCFKTKKIEVNNNEVLGWTSNKILFYQCLPLKTLSRIWGWVHNLTLPVSIREPIFQMYVKTFRCKMDEAEIENLKNYSNLGELFKRSLKPEMRIIEPSSIISPSDGQILSCGIISSNKIEQIKGVTYSLSKFLGLNYDRVVPDDLLLNKENFLCYYTIYLSPGDCHRFFSPVDWYIERRFHFPGKLLSVKPSIVSYIPGLFHINERVIYSGKWKNGLFCMVAVGATTVGSVHVYVDKTLKTNRFSRKEYTYDCHLNDIHVSKGTPFGEFNLGSTIVLIFEAPSNSKLLFKPGEYVKFGNALIYNDKNL